MDAANSRSVILCLVMFIFTSCGSGSVAEVSLENNVQIESDSTIENLPEPAPTLVATDPIINSIKEDLIKVSDSGNGEASRPEISNRSAGKEPTLASSSPPVSAPMDQAKPTSDAKEMIISIQTGSIARYKIGEQLARLPTPITAVGETTGITGKVFLDSLGNISDSDISTINVNVESLRSDKNKRDNWVQRNGGIGPEITIQLTKVTGHPWPLPESGKLDVVIDGNMTISGITNPTEWNGILTIEESSLTGLISTEITWDQFSLSKPKLPFIISVDDEIVLELDVLADIQK